MSQIDALTPSDDDLPPLSDADAAAVLVMVLGDEQASRVLQQLGPAELQLLGEKMCALGDIGPDAIVQAVEGFAARTEKLGINAHGRIDRVHALMKTAIGPVKADNLMERIIPDAPAASGLEIIRWLNPSAIVPLVRGEHPQAIAVLLIQLEPEVAAQVLHSLPPEAQTQVVHRVATMGPVLPEAMGMLEELLSRKIAQFHGKGMLAMGGAKPAADLINSSGKVVEKRVMPEITKMDKNLAKAIENEMFKFEHLFALDSKSMGSLLREVESDILINALKGTPEEQRGVFFAAMSSRAADGIKDEIAGRGRLKMADVIEAQKQIVAIARRLAAEGVIAFGAGGDDDYV
ncbi:flagellar motor switch protein FliG [Novosphingobium sp. FSY-8]|uniref:Flagellar motor switch protein FliG n=1 Tax=Novosphingobium ovatum TaxID=1908523 RepID=A0ABW9XG30_9SPHN|nr:flagellar motor switch protein FliG [Novosphingobium ovatum]NBC37510.1 flagellar motor switch protein FliG [Novosphingobium ovatum]